MVQDKCDVSELGCLDPNDVEALSRFGSVAHQEHCLFTSNHTSFADEQEKSYISATSLGLSFTKSWIGWSLAKRVDRTWLTA